MTPTDGNSSTRSVADGNAADIDNPAITPDTIRSLWQRETLGLATTVATEAVEVVTQRERLDDAFRSRE